MNGNDRISREAVVTAIDRILSRGEFDDEPSMMAEAISWIVEHLFPDAGAGAIFEVVRVVFLTLGIALILAVMLLGARIFLARRARRAAGADGDEVTPVARRVLNLRLEARAAHGRGDLQLALRHLFFALVVGLGQRGNLHYRAAWTNRELLERGQPTGGVKGVLATLLDWLEPKEFGREPASPADVRRLEDLCDRWLGRIEEAPA